MQQRDQHLLALRPTIAAAVVNDTMTAEERFQNQTLRPILKGQNSLLLSVFRLHIKLRKNTFSEKSEQEQHQYIAQALQKDTSLRGMLKGLVIGQFTEDEFLRYAPATRTLDRRMLQLIAQRLRSQLPALALPYE